jgi:hypothetical protein
MNNNLRMGVSETFDVRQREPGEEVWVLKGTFTRHAYDKETGEYLGKESFSNNVTQAGRNALIARVIGNSQITVNGSPTAVVAYNAANAWLRLRDSGGNVITVNGNEKYFLGTSDSTPQLRAPWPDTGCRKMYWRFSDISVDVYTPHQAEFGAGSISFSLTTTLQSGGGAWGQKPNTQNWIYEYELTLEPEAGAPEAAWRYSYTVPAGISPIGAVLNTTHPLPGITMWLQRMAGVPGSPEWAESNCRLRIIDMDAGTYSNMLVSDPANAATYWHRVSLNVPPEHNQAETSLRYEFSASMGTNYEDGFGFRWQMYQIFSYTLESTTNPEQYDKPLWVGFMANFGREHDSGATWLYRWKVTLINA